MRFPKRPKKPKDVADDIEKTGAQLSAAMQKDLPRKLVQYNVDQFSSVLVPGLTSSIDAFLKMIDGADRAIEKGYRDAGAPYGSGDEGKWRWLGQDAEFRKTADKWRDIASRRQAFVDLRNLIHGKGKGGSS